MFLAFIFLRYAVAKLVGTQFISSGPTMEKPVGELSGFEFTWACFGCSQLFSWFVAGGQLAAALLMLFDRTARLGAAVLLPIVANIVVINFAFNSSHDTKVVSVVYLALTLFLVLGDWRAWKWVLWDEPADNPARPSFVRRRWVAALKVLAFVGAGAAMGILLAGLQEQLMPTTPLAVDWEIESLTVDGKPVPPDPAQPLWRRVCVSGEDVAVVTDRGSLRGRLTLPGEGRVEIGYDPQVPPPLRADELLAARAEAATTIEDAERLIEAERNRVWLETNRGSHRRDGARVVMTGERGGRCNSSSARWSAPSSDRRSSHVERQDAAMRLCWLRRSADDDAPTVSCGSSHGRRSKQNKWPRSRRNSRPFATTGAVPTRPFGNRVFDCGASLNRDATSNSLEASAKPTSPVSAASRMSLPSATVRVPLGKSLLLQTSLPAA